MKYIKIGKAYQVAETFEIQTIILGYHIKHDLYELFEDGRLIVKKYYAWDGASGFFDVKPIILPSLVHDIFCEMINWGGQLPPHVQALADEQFRILEEEEGMSTIWRIWTYMAVRRYQIVKKYPQPPRKIYDTEEDKPRRS